MTRSFSHPLPFGAELQADGSTRFRIWAPGVESLELELLAGDELAQSHAMQQDEDGYYALRVVAPADTAYRYRLPDGLAVPDPASRLQQQDVHGPSIVVDPKEYAWRNDNWQGRPWEEMVIYEVHPGCWGGFAGIESRLPYLAQLGVTAIELMPIADFPGERNWGYDGVLPYAPDRSYGSPADLKRLIDSAHGLGLCVYLDVVYNHFGPDGNYLHSYAPQFFDPEKSSPWGAQIDFLQPAVRSFFGQNARYWLQEYRFDGLRFDAVHAISEKDWLDEAAALIRSKSEPGRHIHLVLENERNRASHLERDFDAQWNDDGHNVLHVLLTGEHEGYYRNYVDEPVEKLARMLDSGFVYQGEPSPIHGDRPRGSPTDRLDASQFVLFLQNHDQVGNRACGERLSTLSDPDALRAAVTLQLLCPQVPLLFMDEERGSTTPFLFFTDFHGELAAAVRDGRRHEFQAFSAFADPQAQEAIPDPNAAETFRTSASFRPDDSDEQRRSYDFYHRLLELRQHFIVPYLPGARSLGAEVQQENAVLARWDYPGLGVVSMLVNLSEREEECSPPAGQLLFSSRDGADSAARDGRASAQTTTVFLQKSS